MRLIRQEDRQPTDATPFENDTADYNEQKPDESLHFDASIIFAPQTGEVSVDVKADAFLLPDVRAGGEKSVACVALTSTEYLYNGNDDGGVRKQS